jgi:hypothetical protein
MGESAVTARAHSRKNTEVFAAMARCRTKGNGLDLYKPYAEIGAQGMAWGGGAWNFRPAEEGVRRAETAIGLGRIAHLPIWVFLR